MHLVGSGASRLEGTIHSPWNFISCANDRGDDPALIPKRTSKPTQVVGKRNSWPPRTTTLITGEYCFPFRTHELQLERVLKEAAGNRPTANQHVDDAFVPARH
ncbi:hypothetical protein ALC57_06753 [Trachymyrmex cornetzi]|uniref:Uncharacterized protein n=1 Tax=Trachymyrmex cornetzi TaxID=471704 RepID=A0A195E7M2_9HYME|nr:hypothetical protein ALC57_06753 [Trachymyrmex cornetzi]